MTQARADRRETARPGPGGRGDRHRRGPDQGRAAAAAVIAAVDPARVPNPANKHLAVSLTAEQFRYSFGNAIDPGEADALYQRWTIPAPGRPLFEAVAANFSLHSPAKVNTTIDNHGPLMLIMGGQDHTVPEAITKSTLKQYRHSRAINDLIGFPDRGHSLTIDHGWRDVASACLDWLYKNSL
jgi:pimeloyl-ACP methyl ester carboxylesterase